METVLVVEDEPSIAENICYALKTEGFKPLSCGTGHAAIEMLKTNAVALIILDVGLPDGDGFELAKEIQKERRTPIIFVTARDSEIDRVLGLELGADDYVVKPFSPRELTARVKAVLRRAQGQGRNIMACHADFIIDQSRHEISYLEQKLVLSRYEFRLLEVLVNNPGHVFSRERLMQLVWEEPEMSLERTVDTHIKVLRKKLHAINPKTLLIKTHRGIGYSLRDLADDA